MKRNLSSLLRCLLFDKNAQVLPMMAVFMVGFLGIAALVADFGDIFYNYSELQASTQAAAMAGAEGLATSNTQATTNAALYNAQSTGLNAHGNLDITGYNAYVRCVTDPVAKGVPCVTTGAGTANAIQVVQSARVKTYFAGIFGTPYVNLTATATALMGTPSVTPRNIAVIVDTTASMATPDSSCSGNSRLACALQGVQQLLSGLSPCTTDGCGALSNGQYQNSLDLVSLFTFPEMSNTSQTQYDTDCNSRTNPSITPYTFPAQNGTSYTPGQNGQAAGTYQVTGYLSNYQTISNGSGTSTLNGSGSGASTIDQAVGATGCAYGMGDPGGEGTYYAGVLWAAQASLLAEQQARAAQGIVSDNAIILVSDGAATSQQSQMSGATRTGAYGSYTNECLQAVTAANSIKTAGTTVYTVAYGAQTSGCTTDSGNYTSPCYTMQHMATSGSGSTTYSYADDEGGVGNCGGSSTDGLNSIFGKIASSFGHPRLIPNNTFPSS